MKSKPKPKTKTLKIDYWLSVYFAPDSSLTVEKLCVEIYRKVDEVKLILSQDEPVDILKEKIKLLDYNMSEYHKQRYCQNKEKFNQQSKKYYEKNKEYCLQKAKKYYKKLDKEDQNRKSKKYRDKNRENYRQYMKEYYRKSRGGNVRPYNKVNNVRPYNKVNKDDKKNYQKNYYKEKTIVKRQKAKIDQTVEKLMVNVNSYDAKIAKLITDKGLTVNEIAKNLNMDKANLYSKIRKVPELYQKLVKPVNQIAKSEFVVIKELKKQGQTYQTIANKYNCTIRTIEKIVKGLTKS